MQLSERLKSINANVFADMDRAKTEAKKNGMEIIDLSLGSSDLPTSPRILAAISAALQDSSTHGYSLFHSTSSFRQTVSNWIERKFGIDVDPETEILPLIGSQEGTGHFPLAILNPGDIALCLDPGYPSHYGGVHLAGGEVYGMKLRAESGFLPQWNEIPKEVLNRAKLMVLSYPHNPTTAIATPEFFASAVNFCQTHQIVLVHDFPYVDFVFDGMRSPSVLEAQPSLDGVIEFYTLSKSYNMGGFRVGFAVGDHTLINALRQIKAVIDFNQYQGIMQGAIVALQDRENDDREIKLLQNIYSDRRNQMIKALAEFANWQIDMPAATMYLWAKLPQPWDQDSAKFCLELVKNTGVALSPGIGFGQNGEGYVRFALVHPPEILVKAAQKIGEFMKAN
jgi:aspartate/methionine/tyrosine aminotransferase